MVWASKGILEGDAVCIPDGTKAGEGTSSKSAKDIFSGRKASVLVSGARNPPTSKPISPPASIDVVMAVTIKAFIPRPTVPPTAPAATALAPVAAEVSATEPCPTEFEADRAAKTIARCITVFLEKEIE